MWQSAGSSTVAHPLAREQVQVVPQVPSIRRQPLGDVAEIGRRDQLQLDLACCP